MALRWNAPTAAAADVEKILANTPGVQYATSVVGFSLLSFVRTSYNAFFFVTFKPWDERKTRAEQFQAIKAGLNRQLSKLPAGTAFSFLAAGDSRRRHFGRIHFYPRRSRRQRRAVPVQESRDLPRSRTQAPGNRRL